MARIASLLEQTLKNTSSKGSSNQAFIFTETQTTVQPEKRMSEQTQKPLCNTAFV